jgi:hypothetical protein
LGCCLNQETEIHDAFDDVVAGNVCLMHPVGLSKGR